MGVGNRRRQLPATAPGRPGQITEQPDVELQRFSEGREMETYWHWGLRAWGAGQKGEGRRSPKEQALRLISEPASTLLQLMPLCSSWAPSRPAGAPLALLGSLLEAPRSPAVSPQVFAKASSSLCFFNQTEICSNLRPRFGGLQNQLGVRKTGLYLRPAPISPVYDL